MENRTPPQHSEQHITRDPESGRAFPAGAVKFLTGSEGNKMHRVILFNLDLSTYRNRKATAINLTVEENSERHYIKQNTEHHEDENKWGKIRKYN